jgi:polyisoprenoid-binding protein YceI
MRALTIALVLGLIACAETRDAPDALSSTINQATSAKAVHAFQIASDLPEGTYHLDPDRTTVLFRIRRIGSSALIARFESKTAILELDPGDPSRSRLTASIDTTSVNASPPGSERDRDFDRTIARALGAERSPQITFVSTAIERTSDSTARITGDLSMNGQTHPVVLAATFQGGDPMRGGGLGFSAYATIQRSKWGVTAWRPFVGDQVQIVIEAQMVRG